jgi:hypothetical protein
LRTDLHGLYSEHTVDRLGCGRRGLFLGPSAPLVAELVAASGSSSAARLLPSMAPMFLLRALAEADCNENGPEEPESNASSSLTLLEDPMNLVARGDGVADDGIRCVTGGLKGIVPVI